MQNVSFVSDINLYVDQSLATLLLVSFCLTRIKGHNSVANLRKTTIYNKNTDLVNDDVHTKFGLILSIRSQDIE